MRTGDRVALVLEDEGQPHLKTLIPTGGMDLDSFFRLGIQLSQVLREGLHHRRIIHKDINPNNILVDLQTGRLTLIDFSIASRMPADISSCATQTCSREPSRTCRPSRPAG